MTNHNAFPVNHEAERPMPIADSVDALLHDSALAKLNDYEQGKIITDRFIGSVVAMGDIESGGRTVTPVDSLKLVDDLVSEANSEATWKTGLGYITRTNGMRQAVDMLGRDMRTGQHLADIQNRVEQTRDGIALTSINQVDGYLAVKKGNDINDGTNWRESLREAVAEYAHGKAPGPWDTQENASSDVAGVRQQQLEWDRASEYANNAGVDMELLKRSAEEMRYREQRSKDIGNRAISLAAGVDYKNLVEG